MLQDPAATSPSLSEKSSCKDDSAQEKLAKSTETPGTTLVPAATVSSKAATSTFAADGTMQSPGEDEESLVELAVKRQQLLAMCLSRT